MHAFLADQGDRALRHLDDPRFRGVYIMLASALPLEEARALKDAIVDHAADSKDHHLSDAVVQVLKNTTSRSAADNLTSLLKACSERLPRPPCGKSPIYRGLVLRFSPGYAAAPSPSTASAPFQTTSEERDRIPRPFSH